jgi:hypothetical protein
MTQPRITQIPLPGGSGKIPTAAMQFQDDWPGLFVRGDGAICLLVAIQRLSERLATPPDVLVVSALSRLKRIAEMMEKDVIVREEPVSENEAGSALA